MHRTKKFDNFYKLRNSCLLFTKKIESEINVSYSFSYMRLESNLHVRVMFWCNVLRCTKVRNHFNTNRQ